jgi:hypothetical protein
MNPGGLGAFLFQSINFQSINPTRDCSISALYRYPSDDTIVCRGPAERKRGWRSG